MNEHQEKIKNYGWGSYITAGMVYASGSKLYGVSIGILILAIAAGLLFYRLRTKLGFLKYPMLINFVSFLILFCVAAFIAGFISGPSQV